MFTFELWRIGQKSQHILNFVFFTIWMIQEMNEFGNWMVHLKRIVALFVVLTI